MVFFFFRHLTSLKHEYGQQLLINLLGSKEGENTLSVAYQVSCLFRNDHPFHCKIQILKFGKRNSSLMSRFNTFCFCLLPRVAVTFCNFQFLLRGGGGGGGSVHRLINLLMAADCFVRPAILAEYQYIGLTISYSTFPGMVALRLR